MISFVLREGHVIVLPRTREIFVFFIQQSAFVIASGLCLVDSVLFCKFVSPCAYAGG